MILAYEKLAEDGVSLRLGTEVPVESTAPAEPAIESGATDDMASGEEAI